VGKRVAEVLPHLQPCDLRIQDALSEEVDVAFLALPHGAAAPVAVELMAQGIKVVDLSADFRLSDAAEYIRWYGMERHPAPHLLNQAVYGLPELHREQISRASLVANPGCYPTVAVLALAPAVKHGIVGSSLVIDAKSGVSGAGRGLKLGTHFGEVDGNFGAYSVLGHRHLPEMEQELGRLRSGLRITFVPHLVPMTRGILATVYADLKPDALENLRVDTAWIRDLYRNFYEGMPFVFIVESPPQTKQVFGSNRCYVYPTVDFRTGRLLVVAVIDNLMKGASGQAVQNMNLMLGLPETAGLEQLPLYP
jgi:N-acetyl-gamma-glutamyl-phosphate reductase